MTAITTAPVSRLKALVRGLYDLQKIRVQSGNRLAANFLVRLGQEPGKKLEADNKEATKILEQLRDEYERITDGIAAEKISPKNFKHDGIISDFADFCLVDHYIRLLNDEERTYKMIKKEVAVHPIWKEFLLNVKGCGPALAAIILSEIDISKAKYPSSLWKLAGLDVGPDGTGRSKREGHLVPKTYMDAEGNEKQTRGITFNPFLKTKLVGVLADCMLKAGKENNPYREIYDNYKNRMENHRIYGKHNDGLDFKNYEDEDPTFVGHGFVGAARRHRMALRYMIKRFLVDLHIKWRAIEGLPVSVEYSEGKLGMKHSA